MPLSMNPSSRSLRPDLNLRKLDAELQEVKPGDALFVQLHSNADYVLPPWNRRLVDDAELQVKPNILNVFRAGLRAPVTRLFDWGIRTFNLFVKKTLTLQARYAKYQAVSMDGFDPELSHAALILDVEESGQWTIAEGMPFGVRVFSLSSHELSRFYTKVKILSPEDPYVRSQHDGFLADVKKVVYAKTTTPYPLYPHQMTVFLRLILDPFFKSDCMIQMQHEYRRFGHELKQKQIFETIHGAPMPLSCSGWMTAMLGGHYHNLGLEDQWVPHRAEKTSPSHLESMLRNGAGWQMVVSFDVNLGDREEDDSR